jgi:colanic acid/amylovoran biosynthesis glycosyltransferase
VMPSVVAADGDRDSMPVVVKEALSMEVPVVASNAVGIPEMVAPGWGSLVPPGDAHALASAIAALLDRPAAERAGMGARGRDFVRRHCNPEIEARKLASLIAGVAASEDGHAVADRAARDREQLERVVQQEVGRE